jgi:DNA-binding LacI/PurR family transcriptional regulator/DNA-binding transcriptional regulator YhcF (GntR family)
MRRYRLGVESAEVFLRQYLAENQCTPSRWLPSARQLARMAGVSTHCMWRAARDLAEKGEVEIAPRRGIRRAGRSLQEPALPAGAAGFKEEEPQSPRWRYLCGRLREEVLRGAFRPGDPLPSSKELCASYGSCYPTLRKALRELCAEGWLEPYGKRFRVPGPHARSYRPTILVIGNSVVSMRFDQTNPRQREFMSVIQQKCGKAGINLDIFPVNFHSPDIESKIIRATRDRSADLGYIVLPVDRSGFTGIPQVLSALALVRKPVSVFDNQGDTEAPGFAVTGGLCRIFSIGGRSAGRHVGNVLLGNGHREAVYLSKDHEQFWSQERYKGLCRAFASAGFGGAVHLVTLAPYDIALCLSGLTRREYERILRVTFDGVVLERLMEDFDAARKGRPPVKIPLRLRRHIARHFRLCLKMVDSDVDRLVFEKFKQSVITDAYIQGLGVVLRPLFEEARAFPSATAWVAANDETAVEALKYLQSRGVRVPKELSVTGFDDSEQAFDHGLTSYNFNVDEIAGRTLSFILYQAKLARPSRRYREEIEGVWIERETTSPARAAG